MEANWRKRIQIGLAVLLVAAGIRVAWVFYIRSQPAQSPKQQRETYSANEDDYVVPHKIFPYDVKSAKKELVGKTVWVSAGNLLSYYPYASGRAAFNRKSGVLPPLEKLEIRDVILQRAPVSLKPGQIAIVRHQIMAVFHKADDPGNATYAVDVGSATGDDYRFTVNEEFFLDDPHQLYKHWPKDVWDSISRHEVKVGMNELQVGFALGTSASVDSGSYGNRTIEYTNAGKPVTVTFSNNRAVQIAPGRAQ